MKSISRVLLVLFTYFVYASAFASDYFGIFHNEQTGAKQYASVSLLMEKESPEKIGYSGFINFYLGDFRSTEYATFFYPVVSFNLFTKQLIFREPFNDISIVSKEFSADSLKADVYSSLYGKIGTIELYSREKYQELGPQETTVPNLEGEYIGSCGDKIAKLGLVTFKKIDGRPTQLSYLQQYDVQGQISYKDGNICGDRNRWCTIWSINGGSYDFIKGRLDLFSSQNNVSCEVNGNKISCDNDCTFESTSHSRFSTQLIPAADAKEVFSFNEAAEPMEGLGTALSGSYRGLVFHEYSQNYQLIEADLALDQIIEPEGSSLKMNLHSRLIWGDGIGETTLPMFLKDYKISPFKKEINLYSPALASDIFMRIEKMASDKIHGTLYSLSRGRIGPFILEKDISRIEAKSLRKKSAPLMHSLKGEYESEEFDLSLSFYSSGNLFNMSNPFLPLMPRGYLWDKGRVSLKKKFERGSFDFYTGKFAFIEKDSGRFIHGEVGPSGGIKLNIFSNGFSTLTRDYSRQNFKKLK